MYVSLTCGHEPLSRITLDMNERNGIVSVVGALGPDLYLSFPADEARRVGEALIAAAEKAERAQKRIDATREAEAEADSSTEAVA